YGIDQLIAQGLTGKGQTVVDIVSYGSPTLPQDVAAFSERYGLPPAVIDEQYPLGPVSFDVSNAEMVSWQAETELDVEVIHAVAPAAKIVVLASSADATEGLVGLPEFRKLEQYAFDNHLGAIVSQSWDFSEYTLRDAAGRAERQAWDAFFQATTRQGVTYLAASGDFGATDVLAFDPHQLVPARTVAFPSDDPWVTSVGGTMVETDGTQFREVSWPASGGGFSAFNAMPAYQQGVTATLPAPFSGKRGVPDVAGNAYSKTQLIFNIAGKWQPVGGTSASAPLWAALIAIANQMAGCNLGFINPALYQIGLSDKAAHDFHDITVGNNNADANGVAVQGFNAGPGWDAVTGWGSPNAPSLLPDLIAAIPAT
ncbi:MAG: S53 family peptidase, partial [Ktedonobacterales bacterium]|nr:S53 family peptidase [Ktedonobacterales bacterium]